MSFYPQDLDAVTRALRDAGAVSLFVKRLAANDNAKQQIYLAGSFDVLNVLPSGPPAVRPSERGREIVHAALRFSWLQPDGGERPAPHAKLILYPQYPEVRFSGFLKGAVGARADLLSEDARVPGRFLLLGVKADDAIVGHVVGPEDPVARELEGVVPSAPVTGGVLAEIPLPMKSFGAEIFERLAEIAQMDWCVARRLRTDGSSVPCKGSNCGGYTLESLFGIAANSRSEPDYLGWEIKQYASQRLDPPRARSAITLFTPEPDLGVYADSPLEQFLRRFGYPDRKSREGRTNFGGAYRVGRPVALTRLALHLHGFDSDSGRISTIDGSITLETEAGEVAAGWSFLHLLDHWKRKHARAVYVPSLHRDTPAGREYKYGHVVLVGEGTSFARFLRGIALGSVVYDPGMKLVELEGQKLELKKRSQFRTRDRFLPEMYNSFSAVNVLEVR